MLAIWDQCQGADYIGELIETAWRLVEAQEITATRKLVDSYQEQIILEEMIESQKPNLLSAYAAYHPLLYTPFRYPPLLYGSRFGKKTEPSLWYGSLQLKTAMAEKAFYKFNFLRASLANFGIVSVPLTAFTANIKTSRGIQLIHKPFHAYQSVISNPVSYEVSQTLGKNMREFDVRAFTYFSARDKEGINIGLYTPKAFLSKKPQAESFQSWRLIANTKIIEFSLESAITNETHSFTIEEFMVHAKLPFPAV